MTAVFIGYTACGIAIILAIILAFSAQHKVNETFNAYKDVSSSLALTGAELAEKLARENGLDLKIKVCKGNLTDHYNPIDKSLNISEKNFNSRSIAAQAIVAHEFGHALQDAQKYGAFRVRQFVVKVSNFVSGLLMPMLIIGCILQFAFYLWAGSIVIYVMTGMYALSVIMGLVTLPVEFNASKRAKELLYNMGCTDEEEVYATKELLNSAAMTYVASLLVSLAYFVRLLFMLLSLAAARD